jgi:hypothetical protein
MREEDFSCYSDDEVRSFAFDMRRLFIHDRARHLAVCTMPDEAWILDKAAW